MKNEKIKEENKVILGVAIIVSIVIIIFAIINNTKSAANRVPGFYDTFAQCLTDNGAVMYGASWCSHCKEQKDTLADSFQYIKYIECPDNTQLCIDKGIQGYPTWLIGTTTKIEGFEKDKTMKVLSDATGCILPQEN